MSTLELFHDIQTSGISVAVGHQNHMFGAVAQMIHIVGLIFVLSPIVLVSLRLLGFGLRQQTPRQIVAATSGFIWVGLALLAISGTLIFIPAAEHYYPNPIFWFKYALLALALVVHLTLFRKVTNSAGASVLTSRLTAVLSLTLWFGVALSGRLIGFY